MLWGGRAGLCFHNHLNFYYILFGVRLFFCSLPHSVISLLQLKLAYCSILHCISFPFKYQRFMFDKPTIPIFTCRIVRCWPPLFISLMMSSSGGSSSGTFSYLPLRLPAACCLLLVPTALRWSKGPHLRRSEDRQPAALQPISPA